MDKLTRTRISGMTPGFCERRCSIGAIEMNYVEGPDKGPPLLLIPGQMESWQGYKCVLPELSGRFHIYVPDLRGHGKSSRTPGEYTYNICGNDLKQFLQQVIGRPALVSGLSSGGVLAVWLAANTPDMVLAVIGEDPPVFSSVLPRIREEKFMNLLFRTAWETLGGPGGRDVKAFHMKMGFPAEGKPELERIPPLIVHGIFMLLAVNRTLRPRRPWDIPFLPFSLRASLKFISEYDPDFSRATFEGELGRDFDPAEALRRIRCPMLLMQAASGRHGTWGILGAMDDEDVNRIRSLVRDLQYVRIPCSHEIHMEQPRHFIDALTGYINGLRRENKLDFNQPESSKSC